MMIKAIVFDVGGVILRTEDRSGRIMLEQKYNLPPGSVDQLVFDNPKSQLSTVGLARSFEIWQYIGDYLGLSKEALEAFQDAFWSGDEVDQDLVQFIQTCRTDYTTALLSNAWTNARKTFAEEYGLIEGKVFDHVLISAEIGFAKPDHRIYTALSETIQHPYEEILFIDDFIENILAAEEIGMHTIHYLPDMDLIGKINHCMHE